MKCYFYANSLNPEPNRVGPGIIAFCVPDLGLTYRAALRATPSEFPYKAVSALVRFLEANRAVWNGQKLELLTDCAPAVYQINGDMAAPNRVLHDLGMIRIKKQKLGFTLGWVNATENRSRENVALQPVAKPAPDLNFDALQDTTLVRKAAQWKPRSSSSPQPKV
jgi:hypothetical protein